MSAIQVKEVLAVKDGAQGLLQLLAGDHHELVVEIAWAICHMTHGQESDLNRLVHVNMVASVMQQAQRCVHQVSCCHIFCYLFACLAIACVLFCLLHHLWAGLLVMQTKTVLDKLRALQINVAADPGSVEYGLLRPLLRTLANLAARGGSYAFAALVSRPTGEPAFSLWGRVSSPNIRLCMQRPSGSGWLLCCFLASDVYTDVCNCASAEQ